MNRITYAGRRFWLIASGLGMALCFVAWLPAQEGRAGDYGAAEAAMERAEAGLEAATERPAHRLRASLSMPYFSFAHALRTRS
ncbi:hypothetical protein EIM48_06240 [Pseudoxanthomonas sp. SGNA-20]|mgnify:CR=1 FL=1|jgi:hypothetical protein|uniref:Uncharacterized protein n=1 Tax=Pseudoxanthomonas taiwanensis J19 TaxID=935569 RepID=A0A562CZU5_9GAMM|nr:MULTISPECIES: hypothetical protein [Pseudoxanthomonas]RRN57270.1 hypothetical protein EIM48_06240 [Pseudoxanthomonas sp. SGNA-20]RRN80104.1 hypothetical protein EIM50_05900 [Pseudoxanthomonas sp. SGD-10]TWH02979.1 hypothetical protein L613_008700000060 [Pseudoxanthomonas taiwanensis J19]